MTTATKTKTCQSTSYFGTKCSLTQGHSKRHTWDTNDYRRKKWKAEGKATIDAKKGTVLAKGKVKATGAKVSRLSSKSTTPSKASTPRTKPSTATAEVIDVMISFDTTGSMASCIAQVRQNVRKLVGDLFKDLPDLRIGIIAHGDYCDEPGSGRYGGGGYITKMIDLTRDVDALKHFVDTTGNTHGGDSDECYELVLNEVRTKANWETGRNKVLVMIGDANPHPVGYRFGRHTVKIDWRKECDKLKEAGIQVYTVQCMASRAARPFYAEVAKRTDGIHLELDRFEETRDLIRAVCYKQHSNERLVEFQRSVEHSGRMTGGLSKIFTKLLGREISTKAGDERFKPVRRGRFRVLNVDSDTAIKDLVKRHGLTFKAGRGFYQFTKTVTIQNHKEVVMRDDASGDMFTGSDARNLLGLPDHCSAVLKPEQVKKLHGEAVTVFIQSTSNNRVLKAGTQFLYEAE